MSVPNHYSSSSNAGNYNNQKRNFSPNRRSDKNAVNQAGVEDRSVSYRGPSNSAIGPERCHNNEAAHNSVNSRANSVPGNQGTERCLYNSFIRSGIRIIRCRTNIEHTIPPCFESKFRMRAVMWVAP